MIVVRLQKVGKFLPRLESMSKYWIDLAKAWMLIFPRIEGESRLRFPNTMETGFTLRKSK